MDIREGMTIKRKNGAIEKIIKIDGNWATTQTGNWKCEMLIKDLIDAIEEILED